MITEANLPHEDTESGVENIAVSIFVDILVDLTSWERTKIQITLLIVRRGAESGVAKPHPLYLRLQETNKESDIFIF